MPSDRRAGHQHADHQHADHHQHAGHQHADHQHAGDPEAPDGPAFGAQWWEHHYQGLDPAASGQPAPYLAELDHTAPGSALDAGCGTGADARWLATQGWDVTAVDVSATAIDRARAGAAGIPGINWVVADLTGWDPARQFDLVISQYAHPDQPFDEFVRQLGRLVADGGQLLIVGHDHADPLSSAGAPRDASIGALPTAEVLDPDSWNVEVAATRSRDAGTVHLVDTVVRARKRSDDRRGQA